MHSFHRVLAASVCVMSLLAPNVAFAQAPAPVWPGKEWVRATPEEMGMDSKALATLVEFGGNVQMDSLFVTRWGRAVTEAYYAPFQSGMKHRINSSTKAVIGALAGIAAGQGALDPNAPVVSYYKDRTIANLDDAKRAMTVQQLLDMTSGLAWTEPLVENPVNESLIALERSRDWQQYILDRPMAQAPGTGFHYNSGNSQLASAIIGRATAMPTRDFAAKHLLGPLGIQDFRWRLDPQGVAIGGWGLYLHPADMARFGYLYLNHGEWNGTQVVPRAWADKVFNAKVPMFPTGGWVYADGWWTLPQRGAYLAVGFNRQLILVMPQLGVVAAVTGRSAYPIENVIDHLARAARSSSPLPADPQGQALLQAAVDGAAVGKPLFPAAPPPAIAEEVSGKTYGFAPNEWGWKELTLRLGATPSFDLVVFTSRTSDATQRVSLPLGMDGKFAIATSPEGLTAIQAGWTDASTLSAAVHLPEEAAKRLYELRFAGSRVDVTLTNSVGKKSSFAGQAR
jgi:CubicO group peptidase (beta-lactamase class C family)